MLDPAEVCISTLPLPGATIVALSADQLLLACVVGSTISVYSLPALLNHQSSEPLDRIELSTGVRQFAWCPDAADSTGFLAVDTDATLHVGSLVSGSAEMASGVQCASWSPDGQHLVYSRGSTLVVTGPFWKESAFVVDLPPPEAGSGAFWWPLWAACKQGSGGEQEERVCSTVPAVTVQAPPAPH